MAVLYPETDCFAKVFAELVEITGNSRAIKTTTDGPRLGLVVSDEVFNQWVDAQSADSETTETPRRRPGRPRKSQES